jgi:hypothetical protein
VCAGRLLTARSPTAVTWMHSLRVRITARSPTAVTLMHSLRVRITARSPTAVTWMHSLRVRITARSPTAVTWMHSLRVRITARSPTAVTLMHSLRVRKGSAGRKALGMGGNPVSLGNRRRETRRVSDVLGRNPYGSQVFGHRCNGVHSHSQDGKNLASLLHEMATIEGVEWIRILYAYPSYFTDDLISAIADIPQVRPATPLLDPHSEGQRPMHRSGQGHALPPTPLSMGRVATEKGGAPQASRRTHTPLRLALFFAMCGLQG